MMNSIREIELDPVVTRDAVDIVFAGDLCPVGQNGPLFVDGDPDVIYNDLRPILGEADLSVANLECPLTNASDAVSKSGPSLRADPRCVRGIRAGFQVAALANNHIMDYGAQGLADTLDICRQNGVQTVGAGQNLAEAQTPLLVTIKGVRIAFLAIAEHEFSIATHRSPGAAPVDLADNYRQVNSARQQADLVFVMLHGGNERYPLPSPRLVKVCHFLVDIGSSLVVCNHSHVASGMEIYRDVPIVYGQGNFIFDRDGRPDPWYTGYLLRVKASSAGVVSLEIVPYVQSREEAGIRRMCGKDAEEFFREFDRLSSIVVDMDALSNAWQEFCRTRRNSYLARLLRWGRMKRRLMQSGLEPSRFLGPRQANELLNMFRCESHRDALVQILTDVAIDPRYGN
jgi:hypothetical protein